MNSCVTFRRASTALIIALAALLILASCNKQHSQTKQPSPAKLQPSAALLAADISKLGFIPGKPVTMPPGFKAECTEENEGLKVYNFADGFYIVDSEDRLKSFMLLSPASTEEVGRPGMTEEQVKASKKQLEGIRETTAKNKKLIGPKVPREQQSRIGFVPWNNRDIFSFSLNDLLETYGLPSSSIPKLKEYSEFLGDGVPKYTSSSRVLEYIFQTGENEYWAVRIVFAKYKGEKETVAIFGLISFHPTEKHPISEYKVYPWPGLYPAPSTK
jgi:hypothetical protein